MCIFREGGYFLDIRRLMSSLNWVENYPKQGTYSCDLPHIPRYSTLLLFYPLTLPSYSTHFPATPSPSLQLRRNNANNHSLCTNKGIACPVLPTYPHQSGHPEGPHPPEPPLAPPPPE